MSRERSRYKLLLWIEGCGFASLIALVWLDEYVLLPRDWLPSWYGLGGWHESVVESVAIFLVAVACIVTSSYLVRRIRQLENFLKVCAWCRKVDMNGEWVPIEEYLSNIRNIECTHGMCADCANRVQVEWSRELGTSIVIRP